MKIETKFNINDLVQFKHQIQTLKKINLFEIMEIITQTCYKEAQVFYLCRALQFDENYKQEWITGHGVSKEDSMKIGWYKYREDELIELSDELKAKIEEIKNK